MMSPDSHFHLSAMTFSRRVSYTGHTVIDYLPPIQPSPCSFPGWAVDVALTRTLILTCFPHITTGNYVHWNSWSRLRYSHQELNHTFPLSVFAPAPPHSLSYVLCYCQPVQVCGTQQASRIYIIRQKQWLQPPCSRSHFTVIQHMLHSKLSYSVCERESQRWRLYRGVSYQLKRVTERRGHSQKHCHWAGWWSPLYERRQDVIIETITPWMCFK